MEKSKRQKQLLKTINPHKGWTIREKEALLWALHTHGHGKINEIHKAIPTKTKQSITKYINFYKNKVNKNMSIKNISKPGLQRQENCPTNQWIKVFEQHTDKLKTLIPCALELIAYLEEHPEPKASNGIDFKQMYLFLAKALQGHSGDLNNGPAMKIIHNALLSLSTECRFTRRKEDVEQVQNITRLFLDSIKIVSNDENNSEYPQPLKDIHSQFAYNPLALSLSCMKNQTIP